MKNSNKIRPSYQTKRAYNWAVASLVLVFLAIKLGQYAHADSSQTQATLAALADANNAAYNEAKNHHYLKPEELKNIYKKNFSQAIDMHEQEQQSNFQTLKREVKSKLVFTAEKIAAFFGTNSENTTNNNSDDNINKNDTASRSIASKPSSVHSYKFNTGESSGASGAEKIEFGKSK